jgi:type IV pilus assembly protein PilE
VNARGFTLVEVVIAVALVAVLMALAAPSYFTYVQRAHRTEAIALLLRVAACQERTRARTGAYDASKCLPAALPRYHFDYGSGTGPMAWTVQARPLAAQLGDNCGMLALDHDGSRSAEGNGQKCWSGR